MAANKAQREKERDERRAVKAAEKEVEKALKAAAKGKPKAAAVVAKWSCPADGMVHDFQWKGVLYYRNHDGQIWAQGEDEAMGDWVGMWSDATNDIDDSVADPYADE
jgi:endonuclease YncB( thermonuclease family)